jgi:hypothetical protein
VRPDGRLQVFRECGHYIGRHRACPSDSEEAIHVRAPQISEFRVANANLGSSARLVLCQRVNLDRADLRPKSDRELQFSPCNAPVPYLSWRRDNYGGESRGACAFKSSASLIPSSSDNRISTPVTIIPCSWPRRSSQRRCRTDQLCSS